VSQRLGRGIALLFHDRGIRKGWVVSSTLRPHFTPGKDPVPILQEARWAPGPVWTDGKSRPHRDSIPDCPAGRSVAVPTELPGPHIYLHSQRKLRSECSHRLMMWTRFIVMWPCIVINSYNKQRSHPTTQRPTTATNHIHQNQNNTPNAVTGPMFSWRWA